jgi:hypothetical protein
VSAVRGAPSTADTAVAPRGPPLRPRTGGLTPRRSSLVAARLLSNDADRTSPAVAAPYSRRCRSVAPTVLASCRSFCRRGIICSAWATRVGGRVLEEGEGARPVMDRRGGWWDGTTRASGHCPPAGTAVPPARRAATETSDCEASDTSFVSCPLCSPLREWLQGGKRGLEECAHAGQKRAQEHRFSFRHCPLLPVSWHLSFRGRQRPRRRKSHLPFQARRMAHTPTFAGARCRPRVGRRAPMPRPAPRSRAAFLDRCSYDNGRH